ncbi:helix-turn-helix transcriptional regulator [Shimia sp. SDUM112013]|uniref:helix-turn-helix domain-containing protein n=1 Tax=Shimia sp. SDUM112013 TaxID=3136160 RepID=UPI0032EF0210
MKNELENDALLDAFSRELRRARTEAGISQEELAHRAGKSIRYISLLESRKHQPSLATLKSVCEGLGVSMSAFVAKIEANLSSN